jgi:hypothetical protein
MKRLLAIAVALSVSLLLASTASARPPDTTTGTDELQHPAFGGAIEQTHVNAQSYDGANPRGRFHYSNPGFTNVEVRGDVTCHRVDGNAATVAGPVDEPFTLLGFARVEGMRFFINDHGAPGAGRDEVIVVFVLNRQDVDLCPPPFHHGNRITGGNFVVHDR